MSKAARLFKFGFLILTGFLIVRTSSVRAMEVSEFKENQTGLYRDVFDQNFYYDGTNYLHLDRLYRRLFGKKIRSKDVNIYDEVPDSAFFINRHGRQKLSLTQLEQGYHATDGPDLSKPLVVTSGKFQGLHPGFFVRDARGDAYLLKFDPIDYMELATSAEVIGSRFYHAFGYNVPQYTIVKFDFEQLVTDPNATIVDDTGFERPLTADKLEEYLLFIPQDAQGKYRASASKIIEGESLGNFQLQGRRKNDPDDPVNHENRREIRALRVFSSWVNNYDVRDSNTLDMLQKDKNGHQVLKHYLIDFNTALGSGTQAGKPPMTTYEYMFDFGEAAKAFFSLGWWEKPWQKRWKEAGEAPNDSPAIGYFDNNYFDPGKFKTQLPYYAFKDLTRADAFWAAKLIMSFTEDEIAAMVRAGELSRKEDAAYIVKTLVERRNIIGRYWFERSNPLDRFHVEGGHLEFEDLSVKYGFAPAKGTVYHYDVVQKVDGKRKRLLHQMASSPSIPLASNGGDAEYWIRTSRSSSKSFSPFVLVEVEAGKIRRIMHED